MIYEWDARKAADNERQHGVSFDEAKTVFLDPLAETFDSGPRHNSGSCSSLMRTGVKTASASSARAQRRAVKPMPTKSAAASNSDDLRPEYDLSKLTGAVRGKYYERATAGTTLVLLEPDVAEAFPDGRTVNQALRALIKVARAQVGTKRAGGKLPNTALHPTSRGRKPRLKSKKRTRAARD